MALHIPYLLPSSARYISDGHSRARAWRGRKLVREEETARDGKSVSKADLEVPGLPDMASEVWEVFVHVKDHLPVDFEVKLPGF